MCAPTFESSGRSYSAVPGQVCSGRPRHSRSRRAASQRHKLLLVNGATDPLISMCTLIESDYNFKEVHFNNLKAKMG